MVKQIEIEEDVCYGCGQESTVEIGDVELCDQCVMKLAKVALWNMSEEEANKEQVKEEVVS